ncbi:MAG: hypothetical protein GY870_15950 [archaeon]|nr:hypothetical protein [archaeon]
MLTNKEDQNDILKDENPIITDEEDENIWDIPSTERLMTGGAWSALFSYMGAFLAMFTYVLLAGLGLEDSTQAALLADVQNWVSFFATFAALGFVASGGKFIAEYIGRKNLEYAKESASAAAKYNFLVTGAPFIFVALLLSLRNTNFYEIILGQSISPFQITFSDGFWTYMLLIIFIFFDRLRSCVDIFLIGFQRYDVFSFTYNLIVYLGGSVVAIFLIPLGAFWGFFSYTITAIIAFPITLLAFKKVIKDAKVDWKIKDIFAWGPKDKYLFNKIIKFNLLFAIANIIFSLMTTAMFSQLGELLNIFTEWERITYRVMIAVASLFWFLFNIVSPITQAISESHGMRNRKLTNNYFKCVIKFPLMMGVGLLGFYIFAREEIIVALYGVEYLTIGLFMIIVMFPGFAVATFAEKYDNMLAGINRPDIPMKSWILGLLIAIMGIIIALFLPEAYLIEAVYDGKNWGLSLRFAVAIIFQSLGLLISGVSIIRKTLKVFNIEISSNYLIKPLISIITPIFLYTILDLIFGLSKLHVLIVFIIKIVFLFSVWMVFMVIYGGISVYDARFIKEILKNIPGGIILIQILIPVYRLSSRLQVMKPDNTVWITNEQAKKLKNEQEFRVDLNIEKENKQVTLKAYDFQQDLFNVISYLKIENTIDKKSIKYKEKVNRGEEVIYNFKLDLSDLNMEDINKKAQKNRKKEEKKKVNDLKVQFFFEGYERYSVDKTPEELISRKFQLRKTDYRMVWCYESTLLYDLGSNSFKKLKV